MLFSSPEFIYLYLPTVLLGFFWLARLSHRIAATWLTAASLFFYGWWNPAYLGLLLGSYASPVFDAAGDGTTLAFLEAWGGALAYTLQLYFDFSGYSDMAIGASRLFGVKLPLNFNSPYQALNIVESLAETHRSVHVIRREQASDLPRRSVQAELAGGRSGAHPLQFFREGLTLRGQWQDTLCNRAGSG